MQNNPYLLSLATPWGFYCLSRALQNQWDLYWAGSSTSQNRVEATEDSCWGDRNRNGWCTYSLGQGSAGSNCCMCFHIYMLKQNAWVQSTNCCTNVLGGGYVLFCSSEVIRSGSGLTHEPGFVTHRLRGWPHHDLWRTGRVSVQSWRWHFQHIARSYSQLISQIGKNGFFFYLISFAHFCLLPLVTHGILLQAP